MLVSHFESNESATNCTMRYRANQKLKTVLKTHKGSGEKMHVAKNSLIDLNVIYKSKKKTNGILNVCMSTSFKIEKDHFPLSSLLFFCASDENFLKRFPDIEHKVAGKY
uniref:Uncharacterized protein n=1 Tax=Ceratitis capitata TaxID=7213 RepID=W8BYX4_CERCA